MWADTPAPRSTRAIALLGRWLTLLTENGVDYAVLALSGGAKENVIPKESSITLVLPAGITEGVHTAAAQFAAQMQAEYGTADPAICLQLTEQGCGAFSALDADSTQRLRKALLLMPWGVQSMSMDVPGLVETSLNLGVAELGAQFPADILRQRPVRVAGEYLDVLAMCDHFNIPHKFL